MEPLLLDIPDAIQTERLALRVPRPGDGAALAASTARRATRTSSPASADRAVPARAIPD
jgi:hypothetical protein